MRSIHHITRSFVILSLLVFVLVLGFSGMAMAEDKAPETKAASEAPADGEKKADGEGDGEKKADGEGDGAKKADGEAKASDAK
ncbi:MAG: hypothetical protein OXI53_10335 [Nitrospira sp.]|nr:hypothetical protein [Nitrospira sp.]MDE0405697.1 hypothetical protein [Nitrospira sp.]MDE0485621.1 hypothetical protein [Nitrospira sp.]